jgi:hypothetical protein
MYEDALIAWDDEDDPNGNVQHIAHNGYTQNDFEHILYGAPKSRRGVSRSTGRMTAWGELPDGRDITIVYEIESRNPLTIRPVTAYPTDV